jgi:hypothetical protein
VLELLLVLTVEAVDDDSVEDEWYKWLGICIGGKAGGGGMALKPLIDGGGRESLEEVRACGCFR